MIRYDIFVNCNWVATRWQQYSTHLHTNSTQNITINNKTIRITNKTTQTTNLEECWPCPLFASYTLAFALQLREKHGETSVRVAEEIQSIYTLSGHPHITKPPQTHTHTLQNPHTHTLQNPHIHTPTHYKTHTLQNAHTHIHTPPTHTPTHPTPTHIPPPHTHTLQNHLKPPQYKLKQTQYKIYPNEV
jgi:hypothetical protein